MIILYHELSALTSNSLLLFSRQVLDFRWVYHIALSKTNQGISLVYHPQLVAVYHHCENDTTYGWWYTPAGKAFPRSRTSTGSSLCTVSPSSPPTHSKRKRNEMLTHLIPLSWQGQKDLNPRPMVLETSTLPTELYPYIRVILYQTKSDLSRGFSKNNSIFWSF